MSAIKPIVSILPTNWDGNHPNAKSQFVLFDSGSAMANWALENGAYGRGRSRRDSAWSDCSGMESCEFARDGNLAAAAASDALLSKFEQFAPLRAAWETIDNPIGACPNVPNFISGNPMNMRLKRRTTKESAPLAIIVDSTSSGGITARNVNQRGAAILAFVRAISARRPVELWIFAGLSGGHGGAGGTWAGHRLETAPLDLSHAAPCIASVSWSREVGYDICQRFGSGGGWPHTSRPLTQSQMESVMAVALPHLTETLCIPGIFLNDELITAPADWIARNLARYSGDETEA